MICTLLYQTVIYEEDCEVKVCCFKVQNEGEGQAFVEALEDLGIKIIRVSYEPVPFEHIAGWLH